MRRLMGSLSRWAGAVFVAVAVGACLYASAGTAVAQRPTPVISDLKATPANVGSAGFTVVTATVSGAETCTLSSTKAVVGLPATFSCVGGSVEHGVRMPANKGRKALRYKLKLSAIGSSARRKANLAITVSPGAVPPAATAIAAGGQHSQTCALVSTGNVDCWGANYFGQLGDGSLISSDTPVEAIGITDPTQASVGGDHVCALLPTGQIDCWGSNEYGQLGNGITTGPDECPFADPPAACSTEPVEVTGVTDASHVAAGGDQTCAVLSSGHVECWGSNQFDALGDGSAIGPEECGPYRIACSAAPVEVTGITDATQVSAGGGQTCVLLSTGHIDCWGRNGYGQLGDGSTEDSDVPVEVLGISEATQVSAGGDFTCALLSAGDVDCWGDGELGELGDGATSRSDTPLGTAGITDATQVSAGGDQACALLPTGQIDCWGANYDGQLGDGSTEDSDVPVEVGI